MYIAGIMSGTSLDGVDVAIVDIKSLTDVKLCCFDTFEYNDELLEKIKKCVNNDLVNAEFISGLNVELGQFFGHCVKQICLDNNFDISQLECIASHGQTIAHCPLKNGYYNNSTYQIGEASEIAKICHCDVISDFRTNDIAAGGEGAPLVPISEYYLYSKKDSNILLQNIGGIGNVTIMTNDKNKIFAFDTGPGNMMINYAMQKLYNLSYDDNGTIASKGHIIPKLQNELKNHPYLKQKPPKSCGREQFGDEYTQSLLDKYIINNSKEDIICTLTWFSAYSIYYSYINYIVDIGIKIDKIIIGGGGAHNKYLLNSLRSMLNEYDILTQEEYGYSSDAKEAIAFAFLGFLYLNNIPGNIKEVTGASENVILGKLTKWIR